MKRIFLITLLFVSACLHAEEVSKGEKLFALKVKPLFEKKCDACHGDKPEKIKGKFDMRTRESVLAGGEYFESDVLIPGKGDKSYLYLTTTRTEEDYEMPPKEPEALTSEESNWIRDWINENAPWPDDERIAAIYEEFAEGITVKTSGGQSGSWTERKYKLADLWAYQPMKKPDLTGLGEGLNPVDYFVNGKLDQMKIKAAPQTDALILIRRATFDLTGLPPTPDEIDAFVTAHEADADKASSELVDRLLAAPQYGEQWGRHWLDVVRYADSSGFANDYERPNTWRYRDYVIRSFNEDKPYDQFVKEQIAGDEMDRKKAENLIATGFLRMGPWEHTGMSVAKITRQMFLDDVTDSVGQVFLAHALQCAKCHDHKFDPVPTRDYYSIQAVFSTTQFADLRADWLPGENLAGLEEDKKYHAKRQLVTEKMLAELEVKKKLYEAVWFKEKGLPWKTKAEAKKAGAKPDELPDGKMFTKPEEFGKERIGRKWKSRFNWEMDRYEPLVFSVYNGKTRTPKSQPGKAVMPGDPMKAGLLEQTAILGGGDPFSPGEKVKPGVLSPVPGGVNVRIPATVGGRRLALAEWIATGDNSLTARVMANRVWQYHFGKGLAGNPNNFGTTGKKPTHPKLLDWLATEFVESGWSLKHLHRLIMKSETYRRSGKYPNPKALAASDPESESYAVFLPRRLAAEELRDAMLAVSGELNPEMGGIPIRPDMNLEAALQPRMIMGTFAPAYVPNPKPVQRNRRTIYAHKTRGHRDPMLEVFNQPGTEMSCELRDSSNVTPQVFTLLNSAESADRSLAFANRVIRETKSDEAAVGRAFRLAYGRHPTEIELEETLKYWTELKTVHQNINPERFVFPTEVIREAVDENTGKPFKFTEKLFVYEDYVPDLQPIDVDVKTRAFADVCLALMNSNEFIYVY